jgi:hypothetical protein
MKTLKTLMHLVGGYRLPDSENGSARRLQLVALAALASAVLCAIYGFIAGSGGDMGMAMANLYKMPMVVLLSSVSAIPAGLLAWKLVQSSGRWTDLIVGTAAGTLTGSLILAVLSPLVGLYYATSTWLGPALALGIAGTATLTGMVILARFVIHGSDALPKDPAISGTISAWARRLVPLAVMATIQMATLTQLIALASPILYEETVFDGGVDAILGAE